MLEEKQGIPEKVEDKLQDPEAERATLPGPASVSPHLPASVSCVTPTSQHKAPVNFACQEASSLATRTHDNV